MKKAILLLFTIYAMHASAQNKYRYLYAPLELSALNFSTFNAADFYSEAGGAIYKKPVSGLTDQSEFGYVYGTNMEGMADTAGTFKGVIFYAISMVVNKTGKLIGVCASAAPAPYAEITKRLQAIESQYGAPAEVTPAKRYVYGKGEKYLQISLLPALDDYNKPIPNTFTTRLYLLDKAYAQRIKEGVNENEFAALNSH